MICDYVQAGLRQATYKMLPEGEGYFGEVPALQGVWASAKTLEACRDELAQVIEDWVLVSVAQGLAVPEIEGIAVHVREAS